MIYFKNANGEVFAYETQEERDLYGPADLLAMTPEEVDAHLSPAQRTYEQAVSLLNAAYQADIVSLNNAYSLTLLSDGPSEADKMASLRARYETRKTQHAADLAALKLEYGV